MPEEQVELTPEEKQEAERVEEAQAAEDFGAGFNQVRGIEPKQTEPKAEPKIEAPKVEEQKDPAVKEAAEKAAAEAAAKAAEDAKWANLPSELHYLAKLPEQLRDIRGHIGTLNHTITKELRASLAAAAKSSAVAGDVPTDRQVQAALSDPAAMDKLIEDFPDFKVVKEELAAVRAELANSKALDEAAVDLRVQNATAPLISQIEQLRREGEHDRIEAKHQGWEAKVKTPEFRAWLGIQSAEKIALISSESHRDAIRLLDDYTVHEQAAAKAAADKARNEKRLSGALTPQGTQQSPPAGMTEEEEFAFGFKQVIGNKK